MNLVVLLGNLTRDPQPRYMPSGSPVCNFGLAVNRKWTDKDGNRQESTAFVDCEAFGKTAELVSQYCGKGRQVLIQGRLKFHRWEAQDGTKRSKLTVTAERVTFLRKPQGEPGSQEPAEAKAGAPGSSSPPEEDVPF